MSDDCFYFLYFKKSKKVVVEECCFLNNKLGLCDGLTEEKDSHVECNKIFVRKHME